MSLSRARSIQSIPLLEYSFEYYPPIYAWVFQVASFPQVSTPKPCIHLSSPTYDIQGREINIKFNSCTECTFPREADGHQAGQDVPYVSSDRSVPHSQQPIPLSNLYSVTFFLRFDVILTVHLC